MQGKVVTEAKASRARDPSTHTTHAAQLITACVPALSAVISFFPSPSPEVPFPFPRECCCSTSCLLSSAVLRSIPRHLSPLDVLGASPCSVCPCLLPFRLRHKPSTAFSTPLRCVALHLPRPALFFNPLVPEALFHRECCVFDSVCFGL